MEGPPLELLLLLLAVPLLWFALWPARAFSRVRRHRLAGAGLVAALLVVGWLVVGALRPAPPATADYAAGDVQLRAMLD